MDEITIYTDGGSRNNPGPAAAAFILNDSNNKHILAKGIFLGEGTNNFAEYTAVRLGLEAAKSFNPKKITVLSDSELLVKQLKGEYKVKSDNIRPLYEEAMSLLDSFESWSIRHIPREKNSRADKLVNRSLDLKKDVEETLNAKHVNKKCIRLGVLISGGGTTMMNILDHINKGLLNAKIAVVISSLSNVSGVEKAKKAGLKVEIVRKKDHPDTAGFSDTIEKILTDNKVDLVVQGGWLCLWHIPDKFKNRVMNIHPALLPSFGGQGMWGHHVHEAVLKHGCKISGCTVHFCTNEYDKGPIIVQLSCPVEENDTAETLAARVFRQECKAYPQAIRLFADNKLTVVDNVVKIKEQP